MPDAWTPTRHAFAKALATAGGDKHLADALAAIDRVMALADGCHAESATGTLGLRCDSSPGTRCWRCDVRVAVRGNVE